MKKFSEEFINALKEKYLQTKLEEATKNVVEEFVKSGIVVTNEEKFIGKIAYDIKMTAEYEGSKFCFNGYLFVTTQKKSVPAYDDEYLTDFSGLETDEKSIYGLKKYFLSEGYSDESVTYVDKGERFYRLFFTKKTKDLFYISIFIEIKE